MSRWERWSPIVLVAVYVLAIALLARGITNEDWDGIKAINNALLVAHAGGPDIPLDLQRPPLGWLLMSPWLAWAFRFGGARAALRAAHALWPIYSGALLLASYRFFRRRCAAPTAALLGLLMAFNPILIQFAPFALLDIFSGLALLAFVIAADRYLRAPSRRGLLALAAVYALAFMAKYHLGLLILIPLAFRVVDARARALSWPARLRRFWATPLWLLPAACYAVGVLFLAALVGEVYGGRMPAFSQAWRDLGTDFAFNLLARKQSHWHLYLFALWGQLGPGLFVLMSLGLYRWLRDDGDAGRFLGLALLIPYAALAFCVANKEARYAIPLLPLVYAAVGRGIEDALSRLPRRPALRRAALAAGLALVPWSACLASARYLVDEPSIHTSVPWSLAADLADAGPRRCVGWAKGNLDFHIAQPLFRYERNLIVGAPTFKFFSANPVLEVPEGKDAPGCAGGWLIVPRDGEEAGARWDGPVLAKVYDAPGRLRWEVLADDVRPSHEP